MPRRNLRILLLVAVVSLLCYRQRNPYGAVFVRALDEIHDHYLEPVDEQSLLEAALEGMTSQLDPYSSYIPRRAFEEFKENIEQHFGGVGIQVSLDPQTKQLTVLSPLFGTPAYQAGVLAGDKILAIDGESTAGFSIENASDRLRGAPGTEVRLTVEHVGETQPAQIKIVRANIEVETVLGDSHNPDGTWSFFLADHPGIGYVRISSFSERTIEELREVMTRLAERHLRGLILDLRNNPGGLLDSAVKVSDLFIDHGEIVSTRGRGNAEGRVYSATGEGRYLHFPMVVLVNQFTASASEIVAACLQDHSRATIIGERTWGKGSVQNLIPLEAGHSALKLTMASYWRPSGKNIHRKKDAPESEEWGVLPNPGFEVKLTKESLEPLLKLRGQRDVVRGRKPADAQAPDKAAPTIDELLEADPQLNRAVDFLEQKIKVEKPAIRASG